VLLPDASSQKRTRDVVDKLNEIIAKTPGIENWVTVGGNSIFDGATLPNAATFYVVFKDWEERVKSGDSQNVILAKLRGQFSQVSGSDGCGFSAAGDFGAGIHRGLSTPGPGPRRHGVEGFAVRDQ